MLERCIPERGWRGTGDSGAKELLQQPIPTVGKSPPEPGEGSDYDAQRHQSESTQKLPARAPAHQMECQQNKGRNRVDQGEAECPEAKPGQQTPEGQRPQAPWLLPAPHGDKQEQVANQERLAVAAQGNGGVQGDIDGRDGHQQSGASGCPPAPAEAAHQHDRRRQRSQIEQDLNQPDHPHVIPKDPKGGGYQGCIQAPHVGLAIKEGRPKPFQNMSGHQPNDGLIRIEWK